MEWDQTFLHQLKFTNSFYFLNFLLEKVSMSFCFFYEWRRVSCQCTHYGRWPQHDFTALKKLRPQSVTSRIQPGSGVIVCAEMDEQWGYVGAKSRQRWV